MISWRSKRRTASGPIGRDFHLPRSARSTMDEQAHPPSRARWLRRLALIIALLALGRAAGASAQPAATASVDAQLDAAQALLDQRQVESAAAAFRQAND